MFLFLFVVIRPFLVVRSPTGVLTPVGLLAASTLCGSPWGRIYYNS
jgi:hypothetical protein